MSNELYLEQRNGNGPRVLRKITPSANDFLGFDSNKKLVRKAGVSGTSDIVTTPIITGGLTASGSGANDFSASTGTFKTSTGAGTLSGDTVAKSLLVTTSSATGLGYGTGTGGTVTQATDRSTGVTLSKLSGAITMNAASLAAGAEVSFTVTNTLVAATDVPVVAIKSMSTGSPQAYVTAVAAGSFQITVSNLHAATADTTADVINFVIIKGVAA